LLFEIAPSWEKLVDAKRTEEKTYTVADNPECYISGFLECGDTSADSTYV